MRRPRFLFRRYGWNAAAGKSAQDRRPPGRKLCSDIRPYTQKTGNLSATSPTARIPISGRIRRFSIATADDPDGRRFRIPDFEPRRNEGTKIRIPGLEINPFLTWHLTSFWKNPA